jgi:hypothetical protein
MSRFTRAAALAVLAGGGLATSLLPAVAAGAATTPAITLAANSKIRAFHDVMVAYQGGTYATAKISGTLTGAAKGEVVTLMATQFGATTATSAGTVTLGSTHKTYSFTVTPTLATAYQAVLSQGSTTLATSKTKTVYVVPSGKASGIKACARPTCRETLREVVILPPSALATEMAKRAYPYFNVNLSRTTTPPRPKWLYLGRGHASVSKPKQLQAGKYTFNISYRFYVGNDGYNWAWLDCTKDSESTDGLGLPGSHSCGVKRVSATVSYLG